MHKVATGQEKKGLKCDQVRPVKSNEDEEKSRECKERGRETGNNSTRREVVKWF